ncbi:hypothetical protein BH10CHL1_BH10CHL1_40690 [soil metagenome]
MLSNALLQYALSYGIILSVIMSVFVFGSIYINPEIWLHDAPPEIQAKHGPISEKAKRQRIWVVIPIFAVLSALTALSIYQLAAVVGRLTFISVFTHLFIMFMCFNLIDLVVIDWLIIETIRPNFIFQSSVGVLMTERNYWFHFQGSLKGSIGIFLASLLIAGIVQIFV